VFKRVVNFLFPPELDLLNDEAGFISALLGIGQLAAPFLGKLFGGGAPKERDLPQALQDTSKMTNEALQQAQTLRGDMVFDSQALKDIDIANARSVGAFDPTSFGSQFDFLKPQQEKFANVDFAANPLREYINRQAGIAGLAQQIGQQSSPTQLGIADLLAQGGETAGGGWGAAVGNTLANLMGQQSLGQGIFAPGAFGGGGEQVLSGPPAQNMNFLTQSVPTAAGSMGMAQESQSGRSPMAQLLQMQQMSPLIEMLIKSQLQGGR